MSYPRTHYGDEWPGEPDLEWGRRQAEERTGVVWHTKLPGMPRNHGAFWTTEEDQTLGELWSSQTCRYNIAAIAHRMGRTENSITMRLQALSLIDEAGKALVKQQPDQPLKGTRFVNLLHAITLLQEGYTTLEVVYPGNSQRYTFKVANTLRERLAVDDHVVVFTLGEYKVTKVVKIHDRPEIDVKAPFELKWIVCRVETEIYLDQVKREEEAVERMATAERRKAAEEAMAVLFGNVGSRDELLALINPR